MNRTILRIIGVALGLFLVAVIVLSFIMLYPVYKTMPARKFAPLRDAADANRQDLSYLKDLPMVDRSFTSETRAAFIQEIDQLMGQGATLGRAALEMGVAKAVALAQNGHTAAQGIAFGRNLDAIPLRFAWFAEGLYIVKANPALAELLGAKVVTLGDHTPDELVHALRPYASGIDDFARETTPYFLASPPALHTIGLIPAPDALSLTMQLRNGSTVDRVIAIDTQSAVGTDAQRQAKYDLSPMSVPADGRTWLHLLDSMAELPPFLRHLDRKYWWTELADPPLFYVQINSVTNQVGGQPIDAFLQEVLAAVKEKQPRYIAVDLRFNNGGNYERTARFTQELPKLLPTNGKIFILTSGATFSAAIVTLARLRYFAGARSEIVGEHIGDREQHWGELSTFKLPNSQIEIGYTTGYHDWEHGCALSEWRRCFFLNYIYGVPGGKLAPTIPAPLRFADYVAGADSGLNAVKKAITANGNQ